MFKLVARMLKLFPSLSTFKHSTIQNYFDFVDV